MNNQRGYMHSWTESSLSALSLWLQWFAVGGMLLGLLCSAAMIFVRKEIGTRQTLQLAEAHQKIAGLQPKPLKLRLRALLEQIDPKIIPALKSGRRDFEGGIPASQYIDLERLASEADAKGFITVDPDVKMGIGTGAQGTTYGVKFHVDPSIASD
jgi:hypothetical protein